jgi:putative porin
MIRKTVFFSLAAFLIIGGISHAKEISTNNTGDVETPSPEITEIPSWLSSFKPKLELRYRHEMIDEEGKTTRNRQRIRARLGTQASISDDVNLTFQLASGTDDPVSSNQTLGESFSSKQIQLDIASFNWQPELLSGFQLSGGKIKSPFFKVGKSELIWDSDLNPEGMFTAYEPEFDTVDLIFRGYGFWIEERKEDDDAHLLGGQAAIKIKPGDDFYVLIGGSYFDYTSTAGNATFLEPENSFGNSVTEPGAPYTYDYNLVEAYTEIGGKLFGIPAALFADYVINTDIEDGKNQGWLAGFYFGKCKKPYSYSLKYNYRWLEKDAVVGAFSDSDFIGGGTDGSGHEINLGFQIAKHIRAATTYFLNRKGLDEGTDFHRLQLDISFKF